MNFTIKIFLLLLLTGCATQKRLKAEYTKGWNAGMDDCEFADKASERIIQMRREMRGAQPKKYTP